MNSCSRAQNRFLFCGPITARYYQGFAPVYSATESGSRFTHFGVRRDSNREVIVDRVLA